MKVQGATKGLIGAYVAAATSNSQSKVERASKGERRPSLQREPIHCTNSRDNSISLPAVKREGSAPTEQGLHNYEIYGATGRGRWAEVQRARHVFTGTEVAIKCINKLMNTVTTRLVLREKETMKRVQGHPYVVKLFEIFEDNENVYLVLEFIPGVNIKAHLSENGPMAEMHAAVFLAKTVSGIRHCHQAGVAHRDISLNNIMITPDGQPKIVDFGLSAMSPTGPLNGRFFAESCGSAFFTPPEVYGAKYGYKYNGEAVDVWALGVILHVLLCNKLPFNSRFTQCRAGVGYKPPNSISNECRELLLAMISPTTVNRISLAQVLSHPFIVQYVDSTEFLEYSRTNLSERHAEAMGELRLLFMGSQTRTRAVSTDVNGASVEVEVDKYLNEVECAVSNQIYNHVSGSYHMIVSVIEKREARRRREVNERHLSVKMEPLSATDCPADTSSIKYGSTTSAVTIPSAQENNTTARTNIKTIVDDDEYSSNSHRCRGINSTTVIDAKGKEIKDAYSKSSVSRHGKEGTGDGDSASESRYWHVRSIVPYSSYCPKRRSKSTVLQNSTRFKNLAYSQCLAHTFTQSYKHIHPHPQGQTPQQVTLQKHTLLWQNRHHSWRKRDFHHSERLPLRSFSYDPEICDEGTDKGIDTTGADIYNTLSLDDLNTTTKKKNQGIASVYSIQSPHQAGGYRTTGLAHCFSPIVWSSACSANEWPYFAFEGVCGGMVRRTQNSHNSIRCTSEGGEFHRSSFGSNSELSTFRNGQNPFKSPETEETIQSGSHNRMNTFAKTLSSQTSNVVSPNYGIATSMAKLPTKFILPRKAEITNNCKNGYFNTTKNYEFAH
eukprot:CFRG7198T1